MMSESSQKFKYIVPYVFSSFKKQNPTDSLKEEIFCHIRILCEGGTKLWSEDISIEEISRVIKDCGLTCSLDSNKLSTCTMENDLLLFSIKPTIDVESIASWIPDSGTTIDTLCWRGLNFVLSKHKDGIYVFMTQVPANLEIHPYSVKKLLNTILKVELSIILD